MECLLVEILKKDAGRYGRSCGEVASGQAVMAFRRA